MLILHPPLRSNALETTWKYISPTAIVPHFISHYSLALVQHCKTARLLFFTTAGPVWAWHTVSVSHSCGTVTYMWHTTATFAHCSNVAHSVAHQGSQAWSSKIEKHMDHLSSPHLPFLFKIVFLKVNFSEVCFWHKCILEENEWEEHGSPSLNQRSLSKHFSQPKIQKVRKGKIH